MRKVTKMVGTKKKKVNTNYTGSVKCTKYHI